MSANQYSAGIMAQSFWFSEFKQFLKLKYEKYQEDDIKRMIVEENLFGAPNEYRAKRMYGYMSKRVAEIENELMQIFFLSDLGTQKIINLISVVRQNKLFFDFLYEVYREKIIIGERILALSDARTFFNLKETQDEGIASWTEATKRRVQSAYFNFMTEANLLINDGQNRIITPPLLDIVLERYLQKNGEAAIVKAITGEY